MQSTLTAALSGTVSSVVVKNLVGTHSYIEDLGFTLASPDNTSVQIIAPACGSADDFDLSLDDAASSAMPCPPIGGGTHTPSNPLAAFIGDNVSGTWTLSIADSADQDGGSLDGWGLEICTGNGGNAAAFWQESFEAAHGWTANPLNDDTGSTGAWSAGDPDGTVSNSVIMQPEDAAEGLKAMVTDPSGGASAGAFDIDAGKVSTQSPFITLPASGDVLLDYSYFFAHRSNSSIDDYFRLRLVDSSSTTLLLLTEELGSANDRAAAWTDVNGVDLNAFRGQSVAFLTEAADEATGSLVEAGLDAMRITHIEADADSDGVADGSDNCPNTANNNQLDSDGDGQGNVCDPFPNDPNNDIDGDGISGEIDNCPATANSAQTNTDGDGLGDACDPFPNDPDNDFDGDGIGGDIDNCPSVSNAGQLDNEGDGLGDACDVDDDNDGLTDTEEALHGSDPYLADTDADSLTDYEEVYTFSTSPILVDTDGDGLTDPEEIAVGRDPTVYDTQIPLPQWALALLFILLVSTFSWHRYRIS
ncbi:MAG: thrombospondin type 3 repeat-containing protein [Pseudomonadales bacterium]